MCVEDFVVYCNIINLGQSRHVARRESKYLNSKGGLNNEEIFLTIMGVSIFLGMWSLLLAQIIAEVRPLVKSF